MKETLIAFAAGAGIVILAAKASTYTGTQRGDGTYPFGPHVAQWGAPLAGGVLLVAVHHLTKGAA